MEKEIRSDNPLGYVPENKLLRQFAIPSIIAMLVLGVVLSAVTLLFLAPLLRFFGSPEEVLPYAMEYTRITALGFPFLILSTGGGHLVRADGSPKMTMAINIVGAVVNTVLDAIFVFGFGWGMTGAAAATVICLLYTSPSPRDISGSRMPSSA